MNAGNTHTHGIGRIMGRKDASATGLPVDQYRKQIGKQDYKKTKSVLKATRLKAEAKKNSTGFRVRLSWTPRLFCLFPLACLVLAHLRFRSSVCLPTIFFPFVCLSACLPIRERVSQDHFSYPRLSAPLQLTVRPFGNATVSI
uniref:Triple QxxK/R motif-containing protein n=1 Tax=Sparus aurata TaxID=8175 RepID=A0A671UZS4_SPAAU